MIFFPTIQHSIVHNTLNPKTPSNAHGRLDAGGCIHTRRTAGYAHVRGRTTYCPACARSPWAQTAHKTKNRAGARGGAREGSRVFGRLRFVGLSLQLPLQLSLALQLIASSGSSGGSSSASISTWEKRDLLQGGSPQHDQESRRHLFPST